jgi:hypothetical protein
MTTSASWLADLSATSTTAPVDGLVPVRGYARAGRPPEEVAVMEKANAFGADGVFFEASRYGRAAIPQAMIFVSDGPADDPAFGQIHRRLWSWGGVPLLYRKTPGLVQLFRCVHRPDFVSSSGETVCNPFKTLQIATEISSDPWWDASRLRNGTLWDDPDVCKLMLSASKAAHKRLINAVKQLNDDLNDEGILRKHLRRKLLILSLLIAYLEERGVFPNGFFNQFMPGARRFFQVLANGKALVKLLASLERRFNGNVFVLGDADAVSLIDNGQLARFARLIEGRQEETGQLTLWHLYSFKDLPVELISHIYQLFVTNTDTSVYTPPFLVRLMLDEAMSWERLDRLHERDEIVLDPSCGSGIFLVEAYKRLVLHWRSRNGWKSPGKSVLKDLLQRLHGVDLEEGAIELAAFSLCLALCDALEPDTIRASIKLFPPLAGETLHHTCFFEAKERRVIKKPVGIVVGNPPFRSRLGTPGAQRSYAAYQAAHGSLPDRQLAYLFLHEAMSMIADGGVLSMLQQYNFLYNQQSRDFRVQFFTKWDAREVLDFISVRGLFHKGGADTKVVVVVAEARAPSSESKVLHATFRRSGRIDAEQGFDIDYYDLHWIPHHLVLSSDRVWRADLFGGGRTLALADRFTTFRTLQQYATGQGWDYGEGFIEGSKGTVAGSEHVAGEPLLKSEDLTGTGIDSSMITTAPRGRYERPRTRSRYTAPMLLIREHMDIPHALWTKHYLTYSKQIVGFPAPKNDVEKLREVSNWLESEWKALAAYIALVSPRLFTQKATALQADDIYLIPYPETKSLDLSPNEQILVDDIVGYQRDLIRLGDESYAMLKSGLEACASFSQVFADQINSIYRNNNLTPLQPNTWPGVICQPFVFGKIKLDWRGTDDLKAKLEALLTEQRGTNLRVTRIARIYDRNFIFLIKPNRLRYWLRSVALRDADEALSDLRAQGL